MFESNTDLHINKLHFVKLSEKFIEKQTLQYIYLLQKDNNWQIVNILWEI